MQKLQVAGHNDYGRALLVNGKSIMCTMRKATSPARNFMLQVCRCVVVVVNVLLHGLLWTDTRHE